MPLPKEAPLMMNRCGKAADFDLTLTIQDPCIVTAINLILRISKNGIRGFK
jgi:hypothetical protein